MQLSQENYSTRWFVLLCAWVLAALMLFSQAGRMRDYLNIVSQLGLRGAPAASTPLAQPFPAFAADGQTWVRHALALHEGDSLQLRYTTIDNAPDGREVHWNSVWAWTILGAGQIHRMFTGLPLPTAVEHATLWLTPLVLLVLVVVFSLWATRRAGIIAGVVVIAAMTCSDRMYEGFFPTYVDHHGLLTVAVFGLMLGAVFMGGGWWMEGTLNKQAILPDSQKKARKAAVLSALSGAIGIWVSAASTIPPIALVGISGLLAVFVQGRKAAQDGAVFDGIAWRLWGRVGAGASFVFYLVEYFPGHMEMRLESNHPFYALAWLGAGELIAEFCERWLASPEERWHKAYRLIWPVLAIIVTPLTLAVGGQKVFVPLDPFLSRLHSDYIQEFLPMWVTIRSFNARTFYQVIGVDSLPLICAVATLSYYRRKAPILLWFATFAALFFECMAWWQSRWLLNASGVQVCLALVLLTVWTASCQPLTRWFAALTLIAILFLPSGVLRYLASSDDIKARRVSPKDANSAFFRDIATVLRASQPQGEIVLLASPNASTSIGYYGRFKTIGTLYWENRDGLKTAAAIFSAKTEEEAASLIRAHKITHIALVSEENFIQQYYQLLHPNATAEEIKQGFGYRLFADRVVPQWLEMLPYNVPDDLKTLNMSVMLFKVNFQQSLVEAFYHVALAQIAMGAIQEADNTLDMLVKKAPQYYRAWLQKGELLFARHSWRESAEYYLKGISLAPAGERVPLYISAASNLYNQGQQALAMRIYRAAQADQPSAETACYLAWVLATSADDTLRDGKEALRLAQEAIKADPHSPTFLNSLAAALAENGRFTEAVDAADQALANARLQPDAATVVPIFSQRLAILRSGKPIRQ